MGRERSRAGEFQARVDQVQLKALTGSDSGVDREDRAVAGACELHLGTAHVQSEEEPEQFGRGWRGAAGGEGQRGLHAGVHSDGFCVLAGSGGERLRGVRGVFGKHGEFTACGDLAEAEAAVGVADWHQAAAGADGLGTRGVHRGDARWKSPKPHTTGDDWC